MMINIKHAQRAFMPSQRINDLPDEKDKIRRLADPFGGSGTSALTCQFLGIQPVTIEVNPFLADLIAALPEKLAEPNEAKVPRGTLFERIFAPVGRIMVDVWDDAVAAMFILGSAVRGAQLKLGRRSGVSPAAARPVLIFLSHGVC